MIPSAEWTWIDAAADRFEREWNRGPRPRIEDFLADSEEPRRSALLEELLRIECERRRRAGEHPTVEEYQVRFPEHASVVDAVFESGRGSSCEDSAGNGHAEPAAPLIRRLGDYELIRELGRGGMGIVYEARQVSLDRTVALKVLPPELTGDYRRLRRFEREARAAGRLHHTNIVPVFGLGHHEGTYFYVMQLIRGPGLDVVIGELRRSRRPEPHRLAATDWADWAVPIAAELARSLATGRYSRHEAAALPGLDPGSSEHIKLISRGRDEVAGEASMTRRFPRPPDAVAATIPTPEPATRRSERGLADPVAVTPDASTLSSFSGSGSSFFDSVARIGMQVAEGIDHAHGQGILHRDIKPSNLLLDLHGNAWITDFGLAKASDSDDLTASRDLIGTLRYMAPERLEGRADARSDIYALGLTLYELLALRPAFDAGDTNRLFAQVTAEDPPPLRRLDSDIPRDLATIVHRAIAREPSRRYATAAALAEDLGRFLDRQPIRARQTPPHERFLLWCRRNPGLASSVAVAAASLVLATGLSLAMAWSQYRAASRLRAEQARSLAEKARAETSLRRARRVVNDYLVNTGENIFAERNDSALLRDMGRRLLESAAKDYEELLAQGECDPGLRADLAATYASLGAYGRDVESMVSYQRAITIWRDLVREYPGSVEYRWGLARSCAGIGQLQWQLGRTGEAMHVIEELVKSYNYLNKVGNVDYKLRCDVGVAFRVLGHLQQKSGQPEAALRSFQTARDMLEEQVRSETSTDTEARNRDANTYRWDRFSVQHALGEAYTALGTGLDAVSRPAEAICAFQQALATFKALAHDRPNNLLYQIAVPVCLSHLGLSYRSTGRGTEARRSLLEACATWDKIVRDGQDEEKLKVTGNWGHRADSLLFLGWVCQELGREDEARPHFLRAHDIYRELSLAEPEASWFRGGLARCLISLGRMQRQAGRTAEALSSLRQAQAIFESYPHLSPGDRYSLACCRAQMAPILDAGRDATSASEDRRLGDQAMSMLRISTAGTFRSAHIYRTDPNLNPIRDRADFRMFLMDAAFPEDPFEGERED
ncbi:MAG: serine/threonine-protein kinase [Isosphaeraceae bacterium]